MKTAVDKSSVVIKLMILGALISLLPRVVYAQPDSTMLNRISGFSVGVVTGLGGACPGIVGLEATSPLFLKNRLSIRISGRLNWLETYDLQSYHVNRNPSLGASIVYQSLVSQRTRFYFEIGTFVLFPPPEDSDRANITGYSGTTGLEFFSRPKSRVMLSYFFGGGLTIRGTASNESENQSDNGEDFIFTNGLRLYF